MVEEKHYKINAVFCMEEHKKTFEFWREGGIVNYWEEENGVMCVQYESGNWWHYRQNNKISAEPGEPCLEWW